MSKREVGMGDPAWKECDERVRIVGRAMLGGSCFSKISLVEEEEFSVLGFCCQG